jgi:hypothetical protein
VHRTHQTEKRGEGVVLGIRVLAIIEETLWILLA